MHSVVDSTACSNLASMAQQSANAESTAFTASLQNFLTLISSSNSSSGWQVNFPYSQAVISLIHMVWHHVVKFHTSALASMHVQVPQYITSASALGPSSIKSHNWLQIASDRTTGLACPSGSTTYTGYVPGRLPHSPPSLWLAVRAACLAWPIPSPRAPYCRPPYLSIHCDDAVWPSEWHE